MKSTGCIVPSTKAVVFVLFVRSLLAGLGKNYQTDFHKIRRKGAHGPWKNQLDFSGSLDQVTLWLELWLQLTFDVTPGRTMLRLDVGQVARQITGYV